MALEPITRQEQIIAGKDLEPITRMEKFLKQYGGGGGGGSVPKPLTYDYMPEGYPTKSVGTVTVMEEQAVEFVDEGDGYYAANITNPAAIAEGETYTVNWDGTEYERICATFNSRPMIGNLSIVGMGNDTGEPFLYMYNAKYGQGACYTLDTSASHTISIKTTEETVIPMSEEFLPSEVNELIMNSSTTNSTKKFKITVDDSGTISASEVK